MSTWPFILLTDISPSGLSRPFEIVYILPVTKLSPIESEFATSEDAEAYDAWFRAKVERALASTEPSIPHDEVMARMQDIIDRHKSA